MMPTDDVWGCGNASTQHSQGQLVMLGRASPSLRKPPPGSLTRNLSDIEFPQPPVKRPVGVAYNCPPVLKLRRSSWGSEALHCRLTSRSWKRTAAHLLDPPRLFGERPVASLHEPFPSIRQFEPAGQETTWHSGCGRLPGELPRMSATSSKLAPRPRSSVASVCRNRCACAFCTPDFLNTAARVRSAIPFIARSDVMPFQRKNPAFSIRASG